MTNEWLTNQLGNLLAKRDTMKRSLSQMQRELLGDDFETVHLRPKDADIVLKNYERDYDAFLETMVELKYLCDHYVVIDDDKYPMSATELNKTVSRKYGFSKKNQLPREVQLAESFEQLLQVYEADDSELGIHLRDKMKQMILRLRKFASDKP